MGATGLAHTGDVGWQWGEERGSCLGGSQAGRGAPRGAWSLRRALGRGTDEVFQALEDNQVVLATMKASRFVRPFERDVDGWERCLSLVLEGIEMVLTVQRQWMYLEVGGPQTHILWWGRPHPLGGVGRSQTPSPRGAGRPQTHLMGRLGDPRAMSGGRRGSPDPIS